MISPGEGGPRALLLVGVKLPATAQVDISLCPERDYYLSNVTQHQSGVQLARDGDGSGRDTLRSFTERGLSGDHGLLGAGGSGIQFLQKRGAGRQWGVRL